MRDGEALRKATVRRVSWRLMPFLVVAYLFPIADRSDIGLTGTVFGLAGGLHFVACFLFEVPSNLALERFGASKWIAR